MKNIDRKKMRTRAPHERRSDFDEVSLGYSEEEACAEASRCLLCKKPLCVEGCPVRVDIPGFIKLIREGKYVEAALHIKQTNVLPAVCGRVCPQEHQCEKKCILAKKSQAIAIGNLERFVADYEMNADVRQSPVIHENGFKVAIIGSGPSGLTCAGDLRKMGYEVTVFEALHELGGVLVYGIPEFRLPKQIVSREIDYLRKLGVVFKINHVIGKIIDIDELLEHEGYSAVYISTGAGYPSFMGIPGEDLNFVYTANEFLTRVNLMEAHKFPETDTPIWVGNKVAVIGGGNTAMDAARSALRLGPDKVFVIYRRSRQELPARFEEVTHAEEVGIEFHFLTNPIEYIGDDSGHVRKMVCQKMELIPSPSGGRPRPQPIKGSEFEIAIDSVIIAIGSKSNPIICQTTPEIGCDEGYIQIDFEGRTQKKGVYAGGDIVTGSATVIGAMGAGKCAAETINKDIQDKNGKG